MLYPILIIIMKNFENLQVAQKSSTLFNEDVERKKLSSFFLHSNGFQASAKFI